MSMINDTEEPRVDGQHLGPLREPGSDQLLSPEVRAIIAEVIREWEATHAGRTEGMSEQGQDPTPVDPATPPPDKGDDEREREDRERDDDRRAGDDGEDDGGESRGDPAGV